ncbi:MAG: hypothetical protein J6M17_00275 [Ruminococcus sp.]|nr:hypothetical protein [Ruminococcus sp.]
MRDYGKFLSAMADEMNGEQPKPENTEASPAEQTPVQTVEAEAAQPSYQQPVSSDIGMDAVTPMSYQQTAQTVGYGDDHGQSNIPMQSAAPAADTAPVQQAAASQPAEGKRYSSDAYEQAGSYSKYNDQGFVPIRERRQTLANNSDENMVLGLIGSLVGGALGTAIWVAIGLTGYISYFGALAIVAGAFFGYLLLGKGFGRGGALVVAIVIIASVFVGTRLVIGCFFKQSLEAQPVISQSENDEAETGEISLIDTSFTDFDFYLDQIPGGRTEYNGILGKSYVFAGIAAIIFFARRMRT